MSTTASSVCDADALYNELLILTDRLRWFQHTPSKTTNSIAALKHLKLASRAMQRDFLKRRGLTKRENDKRIATVMKRIAKNPFYGN